MRLAFDTTTSFDRDLRRAKSQGRDASELWAVVEELLEGRPLNAHHKRHRLKGKWVGHWECHIKPDWLLVWRYPDDETLELVRTGTHTDLF